MSTSNDRRQSFVNRVLDGCPSYRPSYDAYVAAWPKVPGANRPEPLLSLAHYLVSANADQRTECFAGVFDMLETELAGDERLEGPVGEFLYALVTMSRNELENDAAFAPWLGPRAKAVLARRHNAANDPAPDWAIAEYSDPAQLWLELA